MFSKRFKSQIFKILAINSNFTINRVIMPWKHIENSGFAESTRANYGIWGAWFYFNTEIFEKKWIFIVCNFELLLFFQLSFLFLSRINLSDFEFLILFILFNVFMILSFFLFNLIILLF